MYSPSKGGRFSTCSDACEAVGGRPGVSGIVAKPLISNAAGVDLESMYTFNAVYMTTGTTDKSPSQPTNVPIAYCF